LTTFSQCPVYLLYSALVYSALVYSALVYSALVCLLYKVTVDCLLGIGTCARLG